MEHGAQPGETYGTWSSAWRDIWNMELSLERHMEHGAQPGETYAHGAQPGETYAHHLEQKEQNK